MSEPCPCGGASFDDCCGPILAGSPAATAEQLMRSRFTAFARGDAAHLAATWATEQRPTTIRLDPDRRWTALEIVDTAAGRQLDATGVVEFRASYVDGDGPGVVAERSRFAREAGRWVYVDAVSRS